MSLCSILLFSAFGIQSFRDSDTSFRNSSGNLHLIERFTLHDVGTLSYEYRIEDPQSYASAWSAVLPMKRTEGPMFEFACHEGNYGLRNILVNARAADRND